MKVIGIILIVLGLFSLFGALLMYIQESRVNLTGLIFIIIGTFLFSRANKNK